MGLFREEVSQNKNKLHGEVLLAPKISHSIVIFFIGLWVLICLVWLSTSSYARKETVRGWLDPSVGELKIYSPSVGVVSETFISDGQWVEKGMPLFSVSKIEVMRNGENLESSMMKNLTSQKQLIKNQLQRIQDISLERELYLRGQIKSTKSQLEIIKSQIELVEEKSRLIEQRVAKYEVLNRSKNVSDLTLTTLFEDKIDIEINIENLRLSRSAKQGALDDYESELKTLPNETENRSFDLLQRLSETNNQIFQLSERNNYIVVAPETGYINNLQISVGKSVNTDTPLLTVVPKSTYFQAKILVPVSSSGFLSVGQEIWVRYDAFPHEKFGLYQGKVVRISSTLTLPGELRDAPLSNKLPVYTVIVDMKSSSVKAYGNEFGIKSGMTFSADITLSERTLIEWLIEPILSLKGRL